MKKQSRRWLVASVAAALLLSSLVANLDNQKLYQTLKTQLQHSGITFTAEAYSLSPMYVGSIRLDDVSIQTSAFELKADRLFIDMDLAALLTGKALPQALYLQFADINVQQQQQDEWLQLMATESFKLKRINIEQSEIHFVEQHVTLTQVTLDVRDIGKNKNPRLELQAHLGEGRLDAHGYLRLKRGEITRGFGRLKIHDIPLSFLTHETKLETLNGSITAHLNQDKSWQSFGHISLQAEQKDELELRGKVTGSAENFLHINDMVLNINDAGAVQLRGDCAQKDACTIDIASENLNINPILLLLQHNRNNLPYNNTLQSLAIQTTWKNNLFSSKGEINWPSLDYALNANNSENMIHLGAGKLLFDGLQKLPNHEWNLELAQLTGQENQPEISLTQAYYNEQELHLPFTFNHTPLWQPLSKLIAHQYQFSPVHGAGHVQGNLEFDITAEDVHVTMDLDASQATINWQQAIKPEGISFQVQGNGTWQTSQQLEQANFFIQMAESHGQVTYQNPMLTWNKLAVDFNHLKEQGIVLPHFFQGWHGYIAGDLSLDSQNLSTVSADLELIDLGLDKHALNGAIQKRNNKWHTQDLLWTFGNNTAYLTSSKNGHMNIKADELNTEGLAYILSSPLVLEGQLQSKTITLPFGPLKDVSGRYSINDNHISVSRFKSTFYEGSLKSRLMSFTQLDNTINLVGAFQAGGVHLNNWTWLHKQFQAHLEGSLYATLNLETNFDESGTLSQWKGDGDVILYNGGWLLDSKNIKADKLELSLRKREQFSGTLKVKNDKQQGSGKLTVDENALTTGYFQWDKKKYKLSNDWPLIQYE